MRLSTVKYEGREILGMVLKEGILPIFLLNKIYNKSWSENLFELIENQELRDLTEFYNKMDKQELENIDGKIAFEDVEYAPLYRNPKKILGIGLNYTKHASDIGTKPPCDFPGTFFKQPDILIGYGDNIEIPDLECAQKTTAEAELGIIIGKECRNVKKNEWENVIAGYTTILDMTEESILKGHGPIQGNPRYLTMAKNFNTFLSFGPEFVTPDEIGNVMDLQVQSVYNGDLYEENIVENMTHKPDEIISLYSKVTGWHPGDVICTGTPRAFQINDGDVAECRIIGEGGFSFLPLKNPVIDLKK